MTTVAVDSAAHCRAGHSGIPDLIQSISSFLFCRAGGGAMRIAATAYILDDDPQVRATVLHVLAAAGYDAQDFSSPESMLAGLESAPPDFVVLDLALGQSDAIEVIRRLEALQYHGKVLLISGHDETILAEFQHIGERHQLAMLTSLRKPFRAKELLARLRTSPDVVRVPAREAGRPRTRVNLAEALDAGWLELWYQPKIDLRSFTVCGAEALLRARHPERGIVSPADLLPAAGDALHYPLSQFVIGGAIADWRCFADHGQSLKLSINLPVCVISAPGFIDLMRRHLPADSQFPGLIVEITEDEPIRDAARLQEVAAQLKLLNIRISFDDFGTAYASIARLLELSCVELKLDRSYVSQCSSDPLKHAVCQTMVDLAHSFGSVVCAEGIDNRDDLRSIIRMGCDSAQGFLFAKPMPRDSFVSVLSERGADFSEHSTDDGIATVRAGRNA
jgi:EAL domain-containing protein (putative c-di-GMP-specific phosphodiesterase class I)/FixJ family two-component response regulator